jgi:fimbrial isopeptide formation D2 family protein/LPXTG-motif cell wall-anchored protein
MERIKQKALSLMAMVALALAVFLFSGTEAFAATVNNNVSGHTFEAYQIFSANQGSKDDELVDVNWGSGVNSSAFLAALKADGTVGSKFSAANSAEDAAKVMSTLTSTEAEAVAKLALANKSGSGTALTAGENSIAAGYYLVVDTTDTADKDDVSNPAILQVTGTIDITAKTSKPTVEKKVKENVKASGEKAYGEGYNDTADYSIGDAVPFKLIGTVPDMSKYTTYKYSFNDTLSSGLTAPEKSAIKVYVADDKAGANKTEITDSFAVSVSGQNITVSTNDLKSIAGVSEGKFIIVEYEATLNSSAALGQAAPGNTNEVSLVYSNNPDQSGGGENQPTGETPKDKVIVFTYELDGTKVDGETTSKTLKDAEFVLKNSDGTKYAKVTDGKFAGWTDKANATTLKSDGSGLFKVAGLDDGTYLLEETKAPSGYNKLTKNITVKITADTTNGQSGAGAVAELKTLSVTADGKAGTADAGTGVAGITVANNAGFTLPGTGGIGTLIFFVGGGIVAVTAATLLILKKRREASRQA